MKSYDNVCESYEEADKVNTHFLHEYITEKTKRVVRGGKIVRKKICKDGYVLKDGRCVKQTAKDKLIRKKASKKMVRKKKGKSQAATIRKRKKSMKKSARIA